MAGHILGVAPAVRAEMFAAVWRDRTRRARLHQALRVLKGDPETAQDGRRAGELLGRLSAGARSVSLVDAMLAAVAERTPAVVLTDDHTDFGRLRAESGWLANFREA